ncbi:fungal hydrophobin [Panus rudis PR-1116 ss-1]|nr:fungal hydrophobin [Panus rudis PR-1116 ss-1]
MLARFATFTTLSLAAFATATPAVVTRDNSCSTGEMQCCNSVQQANDPSVAALTGLLGIVLGPIDGLVGVTCNPIQVIGVGGGNCKAQAVCCTNNSFGSLISLGCVPVSL